MSVSSLSLTFVSVYPPQASRAAPSCATRPAPAEQACGHVQDRGVRRNVLADAMMSALQELGFQANAAAPASPDATTAKTSAAGAAPGTSAPASSTVAPPASPTPAATAAKEAPDSTPGVQEAVFKFAHELFNALRSIDGEKSKADRNDDGHHHHGHRHGSHRAEGRDYAGFAQRLETLAASFVPAAPATPAAAPAVEPSPTPPAPATAVDATPVSTAMPPAQAPVVVTASAAPASTPQSPSNKLVDAFAGLLRSLHMNSPTAPAGNEVASRLGSFLHHLAQALVPAGADTPPPTVGVMLDVTA